MFIHALPLWLIVVVCVILFIGAFMNAGDQGE
jgi:hypothetical protein